MYFLLFHNKFLEISFLRKMMKAITRLYTTSFLTALRPLILSKKLNYSLDNRVSLSHHENMNMFHNVSELQNETLKLLY